MCRYGMTTYKPHYACFNCRKTFKRILAKDIKVNHDPVYEAKCPDCGNLMADMGLDFASPKKEDVKKWEHLKSLYSVGITFHSCGCNGPGYIPNSKEKLIEHFEELKKIYLKNIDFWRSRKEPISGKERDKDNSQNWYELGRIRSNYKKEIVNNQEGVNFWLAKVREIENKINLI